MKRKNEYNYYNEFIKLSEYSLSSANFLHETLCNFSAKSLTSKVVEMHDLEHRADQAKHVIMEHLSKEFLPPIERLDICNLTQAIDDVTDAIEDVLICIDMFNIQSLRIEILQFSKLIVNCCSTMLETMKAFRDFKTSKTLHEKLIKINHLEEVGDALYVDLIRSLYRNAKDSIQIMCWSEILHRLEQCCNNCEYVANTVESIIINNT